MKALLVGILLVALLTDPMKITRINQAKREAQTAFNKGDFKTAIAKYKYLSDSLGVKEDELMLNLAHAYFQSNDTANAHPLYQQLTTSKLNAVRSKAQLQLGILNHQQNKPEQALNNFKQAIKSDPTNMDARYNYEMLKKKMDEKKKQEEQQKKDQQNKDQKQQEQQNKDQQKQDQQNKDQQKQDQKDKDQQKQDQQNKEKQKEEQQKKDQQQKDQQDQKSQEQKQKEEKEKQQKEQQQEQKEQKDQKKDMPKEVSDKLEQMKIDPEKAKMILDAMKNNEVQYLQQNKRKASKAKDKSKPDW